MLVQYGVGRGKETQDLTKKLVKIMSSEVAVHSAAADSVTEAEEDLLKILENDSEGSQEEEEEDQKETLERVLAKLKINQLTFNQGVKVFLDQSTYP